MPPIPKELVGTWHASGQAPAPSGGHGMSWMMEYTVEADGTFVMNGYPPITVLGKLQVAERDGNRVRILMTERTMSGSKWPDLDQWGVLSEDGKTLDFDQKSFQLK